MKFKVDAMPNEPHNCPFCNVYWSWEKVADDYKCKLDGETCYYFCSKSRNPLECAWLIDQATEDSLTSDDI